MIGHPLDPGGTTTHPSEKPTAVAAQSPTPSRLQERTFRPPEKLESTPSPDATSSAPTAPRATAWIADAGNDHFDVAPGTSGPMGGGHLVTYSVEVEDDLPFAVRDVAADIDRALRDRLGWTAVMDRSVQRVPTDPTFRIRLATPGTTDALCAPLDTGGRLSCRNGQMVVLNAWRWALGATTYGDDLEAYRVYMVNHEFGHALGNSHASCPATGSPAPVMVQQTKGLEGCTPNPWPAAG